MKKKILFLLLVLCMLCSTITTNFVYANEVDEEYERQYILEFVPKNNDSEDEIQFELWLSPASETTQENLFSTQINSELVLTVVVKREGSKIKINCKNVSYYMAYNMVFATTVAGLVSSGTGYWSHTFLPANIPILSPGTDSGSISYTMPALLNNPQFVEVGVSATINGELCYGYGLLNW